jgi:hypothetical protein
MVATIVRGKLADVPVGAGHFEEAPVRGRAARLLDDFIAVMHFAGLRIDPVEEVQKHGFLMSQKLSGPAIELPQDARFADREHHFLCARIERHEACVGSGEVYLVLISARLLIPKDRRQRPQISKPLSHISRGTGGTIWFPPLSLAMLSAAPAHAPATYSATSRIVFPWVRKMGLALPLSFFKDSSLAWRRRLISAPAAGVR